MAKRNKKGLLDRLKDGVVIGAEGYVFELERRGYIKAGPYVPEVVLDYPEAVLELHREFLRAGTDVIEALTYYANENKLDDVGRTGELEKLNRAAVRQANEVADEGDALVAGNICNTWMYDPNNKAASAEVVRTMYEAQLKWAVEEGVDFVIAETLDYLGEAMVALEVIKSLGLPAVINLSTVQATKTRDGYDYAEACKMLADNGADVVGLNCSRGPETLFPIMEKVQAAVDCYTAMLPVPYKTTPRNPTFQSFRKDGRRLNYLEIEQFLCTRFEMADFAKKAKEMGVNYIGICCGAFPYHVRAMAEALGRTVPASKYSPALELHPMIGSNVQKKDEVFLGDWKG